MFIIGEKINGMFASVARAVRDRDEKFIRELAASQEAAGADAIDINVGPASDDPVAAMEWLVVIAQKDGDRRLSIDTPSPDVMARAASLCKNRPILNSATAAPDKLSRVLDIAKSAEAQLVALAMDEKGIPSSNEKKLELAALIVEAAAEKDIGPQDIFIDPVLLPAAVAQDKPREALELISQIKLISDPSPKTVVGLSNVSQGAAPALRSLVNRTYLAMAVHCGLDAAIMDPLDGELMKSLAAAEVLADKFIYCESFVESFKKSFPRQKT